MKKILSTLLLTALLTGCSNYFSRYDSVYRIETTTGVRYYSEGEPDFNEAQGVYEVEDLDGNSYQLPKTSIYKIEKYRHLK